MSAPKNGSDAAELVVDGDFAERDEKRDAIIRGLGFSPELQGIFRAGILLRDSTSFPGRKYFLAHAARELRRQLSVHIREFHRDPVPDWQREGRQSVSAVTTRRWVTEISPRVAALGETSPTPEMMIEVSAEIVVELDLHMNRWETVRNSRLDRMMSDLRRLQEFVPIEALDRAVAGLANADATPYAHVRSLGGDFSDSEVVPIWDELEQSLFELLGSAAWAFNSIDQVAADLNAL